MSSGAKDTDIAISVKNVNKTFKLPHEKQSSLKGSLINFSKRGYEKQQVLKDISFDIKKGEFFGIVGRNGSGKSTLLKLISQIYTPDGGSITVSGKLTPFIELGVGFNPELSGRDNVYLNGALLGFNKEEMDAMYDEIVEFAELERFMDQMLKNYSSGMQVRLAFSIAIRANSDILVLDEVLAVGDEAFQRKCEDYFSRIRKDKTKTVILVTHSMESIRKHCSRAMMIDKGNMKIIGDPEDVANEYSLENVTHFKISSDDTDDGKDKGVSDISVELLSKEKLSQDDELSMLVAYKTNILGTKIVLNVIDYERGVPLLASNTKLISTKGLITRRFKARIRDVNDTSIGVNLSIRDENNSILAYSKSIDLPKAIIRRSDYPSGSRATHAVLFDRGVWSE